MAPELIALDSGVGVVAGGLCCQGVRRQGAWGRAHETKTQRATYDTQELASVEGFRYEIEGAQVKGLEGVLQGRIAGDHDDLRRSSECSAEVEDLEAGCPGQLQVA